MRCSHREHSNILIPVSQIARTLKLTRFLRCYMYIYLLLEISQICFFFFYFFFTLIAIDPSTVRFCRVEFTFCKVLLERLGNNLKFILSINIDKPYHTLRRHLDGIYRTAGFAGIIATAVSFVSNPSLLRLLRCLRLARSYHSLNPALYLAFILTVIIQHRLLSSVNYRR